MKTQSENKASTKKVDDTERMMLSSTLDEFLKDKGMALRNNVRWLRYEVSFDAGKTWLPLNDGREAIIKDKLGARSIKKYIWRELMDCSLAYNEVDPFMDYLKSLRWDNVKRIDNWCATAFKLKKTRWNSQFAEWTGKHIFVGAVKRAYDPGYPMDTTPILVGKQGLGKSKHLAVLFPSELRSAFSDEFDLSGGARDRLQSTQGKVLIEIAELNGMTRAKFDRMKAFMTRTHDNGRLAYRHNPEHSPRRCVFIGTVNDDGTGILPNDTTGNRRWLPVEIEGRGYEFSHFEKIRDQLWAEARHRVAMGDDPSLPEDYETPQREINEFHRQSDEILETPIIEYKYDLIERCKQTEDDSGNLTGLTLLEISEVIGMRITSRSDEMRLARALTKRGYLKNRVMVNGHRANRWLPPRR